LTFHQVFEILVEVEQRTQKPITGRGNTTKKNSTVSLKTLKAADNKVQFTGSIRETICKLAALTDAPRANGDADEWKEWHEEQYESLGRFDPDQPFDPPDMGYSDDDFWADKFHLVQCWDKEGTFLRFEIVPADISLRGAVEKFAGQFIDKTRHKNLGKN